MSGEKLNVGFFINPFAGAGGPAGFKGSDSVHTQSLVQRGEISARSPARAQQFFQALRCYDRCRFYTVKGPMGIPSNAFSCHQNGDLLIEILDLEMPEVSTAETTQRVVTAMMAQALDLLVFVGGDGTARDVCQQVQLSQPVLGVPAGVKMHSGVFAITPQAAASVVNDLAQGNIVSLVEREVRDIDEVAFQQGRVVSHHYGDMMVPEEVRYMQSVKQGGIEQDELVLHDIAEEIKERLDDDQYKDALLIFAGGSTTQFVEKEMGISGTLLGVDLVHRGQLVELDCDAKRLENAIKNFSGEVVIVVTVIGGQGHIIGRGNQQLSPEVIRRAGKKNVWVIASKAKLESLDNRPLLFDSGDSELDRHWQGLIPVITGYRDQVLYRLDCGYD